MRPAISTPGPPRSANSGLRGRRRRSKPNTEVKLKPQFLRSGGTSDSLFSMMMPNSSRSSDGWPGHSNSRQQSGLRRLLEQSYVPLAPSTAVPSRRNANSQSCFQWSNGPPISNNNAEQPKSLSLAQPANAQPTSCKGDVNNIRWHKSQTEHHSISKSNLTWPVSENKSVLTVGYWSRQETSKRSSDVGKSQQMLPLPCRHKKYSAVMPSSSTIPTNFDDDSEPSLLSRRPRSACNLQTSVTLKSAEKSEFQSEVVSARETNEEGCTSQDLIETTLLITNSLGKHQCGNILIHSTPVVKSESTEENSGRNSDSCHKNSKKLNAAPFPSSYNSPKTQNRRRSVTALATGKCNLNRHAMVLKTPHLVSVGTQKLPITVSRFGRVFPRPPKKLSKCQQENQYRVTPVPYQPIEPDSSDQSLSAYTEPCIDRNSSAYGHYHRYNHNDRHFHYREHEENITPSEFSDSEQLNNLRTLPTAGDSGDKTCHPQNANQGLYYRFGE